jgi:PPOX class probable F420-dependent enzyme
VVIDTSTRFGQRVIQRLREEIIIWLTTVSSNGTPTPAPVWFYWDADAQNVLIYSFGGAKRLDNLRRNPNVALNFDGDGKGGNIVVFQAEARISDDPPAYQMPAYVNIYRDRMVREWGSPEKFSEQYSVPLRITPTRVLGH